MLILWARTGLGDLMPGLLLFAALANADVTSEAVGYVDLALGNGTVQSQRLASRLVTGELLWVGATIHTSRSGTATLRFADGQVIVLAADSELRIDRYEFDPRNPSRGVSVTSLSKGAVRVVAGVIGTTNPRNLHIVAGAGNIEVNASDATVIVDSRSQTVQVAANAGSVALQTSLGTTAVGAGQYAKVVTGRAPATVRPVGASPAVVQATVAALKAVSTPANTPVEVALAASTARDAGGDKRPTPPRTTLDYMHGKDRDRDRDRDRDHDRDRDRECRHDRKRGSDPEIPESPSPACCFASDC